MAEAWHDEAFPWWRKAAAQGLFLAARNVCAGQVRGSPGPKDPDAALRQLDSDELIKGGHRRTRN